MIQMEVKHHDALGNHCTPSIPLAIQLEKAYLVSFSMEASQQNSSIESTIPPSS